MEKCRPDHSIYLESGADMIFTEALESENEFRKFAREVRGDLLANMTEFGKSPLLTTQQLKEIGYKAVIFPAYSIQDIPKGDAECVREIIFAWNTGQYAEFHDEQKRVL